MVYSFDYTYENCGERKEPTKRRKYKTNLTHQKIFMVRERIPHVGLISKVTLSSYFLVRPGVLLACCVDVLAEHLFMFRFILKPRRTSNALGCLL